MSPVFDLSEHHRQQLTLLQTRLGEISQFLVSLHLATANYDPENVKDESCLFHLGTHIPSTQDHTELYRMAIGTEEFAVRMGILAMCTTTEECISNLLLPFCTAQQVIKTIEGVSVQDWHEKWLEQHSRLLSLTFGNLIARLEAASETLDESALPQQWPTIMAHLKALNKLRNCIAHRLGFVAERDIDPATSELSFSWSGIELHVDGTRMLGSPKSVGAGSIISASWKEQKRSWALGDHIVLIPDEAQQVAIYLVWLLSEVSAGLIRATIAQFKGCTGYSSTIV